MKRLKTIILGIVAVANAVPYKKFVKILKKKSE